MSQQKLAPREPFQNKRFTVKTLASKNMPFYALFCPFLGRNAPESVPNAPKNVSLTIQADSHFLKNMHGKTVTSHSLLRQIVRLIRAGETSCHGLCLTERTSRTSAGGWGMARQMDVRCQRNYEKFKIHKFFNLAHTSINPMPLGWGIKTPLYGLQPNSIYSLRNFKIAPCIHDFSS
jgi:hypothetical protein